MARKPGRMANLGKKTFEKTDAELSDNEANILLTTSINWEDLRPQVSDKEAFDKLITAVQESTQNNENLAQIKTRLTTLGKEGIAVAKKVVDIIA